MVFVVLSLSTATLLRMSDELALPLAASTIHPDGSETLQFPSGEITTLCAPAETTPKKPQANTKARTKFFLIANVLLQIDAFSLTARTLDSNRNPALVL
jgi:hypothetical protein